MIISGGDNNNNQLVKYEISNDVFVDFGVDYLSSTLGTVYGESGNGGYFTQINETTLFTVHWQDDSISVYNLQTLSYREWDTSIPLSSYHGENACISSSDTPIPRLYITGGIQ